MKRLRGSFSRSGSFNADSLGHDAVRLVGNLCFALFVVGVLVFTIIAATYQPDDPLLHPTDKIASFLTSTSNATFRTDGSTVRTGEDFIPLSNDTVTAETFIHLTDIVPSIEISAQDEANSTATEETPNCDTTAAVDCSDQEIFNTLMRAAIEEFKDVHFYRFGKPVRGGGDLSCDMAWRFRPKNAKRAAFYKDYRRFEISRDKACSPFVSSIGEYHSGLNARKKKRKNAPKEGDLGFGPMEKPPQIVAPLVGELVNDSLPVVESEGSFSSNKYLIYSGGGDRCKSMDQYLWSFLCALGEAQYLNRTLVMDLSICLSAIYSSAGQHEEGKDFRFYFDFEHLKETASVLDQREFWADWGRWQKKDKLGLYLVEDFRVTPMKLSGVKDALIMRKFGDVEPDNYWYRVCEGETEAVIQRPWDKIWKSRRLMEIVSGIASKMSWDFDSVHVVRGDKAKNTELWPNLAADTSPDALLATLKDKIDDGRKLYVATNEEDVSLFDPLKDKYETHFLDEFKDFWAEGSEWYQETSQLNNGVPVEFDGYMRLEVDTEVFLRGKKQLETFNDLTNDCKDGVNTCKTAA
ncbi:calcium ion-binding protein [Wolffia australiana]